MLYVSTRNTVDVYTAYRALHESVTPDGGYFVPFRLSMFFRQELSVFQEKMPCESIANILNHLFGLHLSGWDVECAVGRHPFHVASINQRLIMVEMWRNPQGHWDYLLENLNELLLKKRAKPVGWVRIAIGIALLFGLYSSMDVFPENGLDVAVTAGDFSDMISILYAKDMGLPINCVICSFNENSAVWDFIKKGYLSTGVSTFKANSQEMDVVIPKYLEYFVYRRFGTADVLHYLQTCENKSTYYITDEQLETLNGEIFAAVVSSKRVEHLRSGFLQTNQYEIDSYTAHAYGGIQDYRSRTGINRETVFFVKKRPNHVKE